MDTVTQSLLNTPSPKSSLLAVRTCERELFTPDKFTKWPMACDPVSLKGQSLRFLRLLFWSPERGMSGPPRVGVPLPGWVPPPPHPPSGGGGGGTVLHPPPPEGVFRLRGYLPRKPTYPLALGLEAGTGVDLKIRLRSMVLNF